SGEGRSQTDIALKGNQIDLIKKINEVNKNIVVVLMTGRPVPLTEVSENSKAILQTWFAGSEAGNAIADVLFGDFSPAGKLPVSFPYHGGQEPLYYCRKSTGRQFNRENNVFWSHYTDGPNDALYPFGYGLTYTTFEYSNLDIAKTNKGVSIGVDITNTGERAGTEVVQLYIRDVAASLARPIKELKGFQKKKIDKGKTLTIEFNLTIEDLSFYNTEGEKVYEPGEFEIMVGPDSKSVLSKKVTLE
ncbi:MAG: glycoside hydrolase family 3 C-terminal domain-containing protein, partial [Bacteroidota bacterium]